MTSELEEINQQIAAMHPYIDGIEAEIAKRGERMAVRTEERRPREKLNFWGPAQRRRVSAGGG